MDKLRAIGVSNFERVNLDNLLENGRVAPMVNQILAYVSNTPSDLIDVVQGKGLLVEAHSPFGLVSSEVVGFQVEAGVVIGACG